MQTSIEFIDSVKAQELLALNTSNRDLNKPNLKFLVSEMLAENFKETGQSISISNTGKLLDGQHRLQAIVESGKAYNFIVVKDLPDEVFSFIDIGRTRKPSDILFIKGFNNPTLRSSLIKKIILFNNNRAGVALNASSSKNGGSGTGEKISLTSNQQILEFAENNNLNEYVEFGIEAFKTNKSISKTDWAFVYYLLSKVHQEDASTYLKMLATGSNLKRDHQILNLRNKMLSPNFGRKVSNKDKIILIIKSWNWYRKGKETGNILVQKNEELPVII